tara:strand:- start:101 stop:1456 length:1356 start_codon:yes stop_codon:yes gene_type:complete
MAKVTKEIISPLHINENGDTFICLDGKAFLVKENQIEEANIMSSPGEFRNLALALEHFQITENGITWYNGATKIRYFAETNKTYLNNTEMLGESISNHLLLSGVVNYNQKSKIDLFEFACKNYNRYSVLEFAQKIEEGSVKCYVMKLNENFFIYRMNESNKIYKFGKLNANEAFDYIKEQTGYELADMAGDLLEGERVKAAKKQAEIEKLEEMIAFLKDQRGIIAEADKSIEEIKEADTLINNEIKRLEEEVQSFEEFTAQTAEEHELEQDVEDENKPKGAADMEEASSDASDTESMEDGEEAGEPAEEVESDAKEVDNEEDREEEGEEPTHDAPEASGEDAGDEVAPESKEDDEVEDEGESDVEESEELEAEKKTNEAGLETQSTVNRADGYVPATLNRKTENYAEGTEMKVDAEDYTTSGADENITVFIGEQPTKVLKRHISLANTETI